MHLSSSSAATLPAPPPSSLRPAIRSDTTSRAEYEAPPLTSSAEPFGATVRFDDHGVHSVYCGGRIVFGPQPLRFVATLLILAIPYAVVAGTVIPYAPWPLTLVATVCVTMTLLLLCRVATADPGIVPKRLSRLDVTVPTMATVRIERQHGHERTRSWPPDQRHRRSFSSGSVVDKQPSSTEAIMSVPSANVTVACCGTVSSNDANDAFEGKIKFCSTCQRYRGPRTFHCADCDRCIDLYDHHCPWIGTCVGAFNYAYFLWFVTFLQATIAVTFATCIYVPYAHSVDAGIEMSHALQDMGYIPVLMLVYMFALGTPSSVLTWFHYYLVCRGQLTIEHLRRTYETEPNPYDRGCVTNCGRFCGDVDVVALADYFRQHLVNYVTAARERFATRKQREPIVRAPSDSTATPTGPGVAADSSSIATRRSSLAMEAGDVDVGLESTEMSRSRLSLRLKAASGVVSPQGMPLTPLTLPDTDCPIAPPNAFAQAAHNNAAADREDEHDTTPPPDVRVGATALEETSPAKFSDVGTPRRLE